MRNHKEVSTTAAEETVGWVLDFISRGIDNEDSSSKWIMSVEAHKYLRLWDISSTEGALYIEPPKLDLRALQMELSSAFDTYLRPLLEGEKNKPMLILSRISYHQKFLRIQMESYFATGF